MNILAKFSRKLWSRAARRRRERILGRLLDRHHESLFRIRTSYGDWIVPETALIPGGTAVCVGAGEDISFDLCLNKRGMRVFTADPTPRAVKHVRQVLDGALRGKNVPIGNSRAEHYDFDGFDPNRFTFLDVGLSDRSSVLRFWAPKDPSHVSHSIVNLQRTEEYFDAQCVRLQDLCAANGIDRIEILKLSVGGAEYAVLKDLVEGRLRPRVVCVEFDEGPNVQDTESLQRISDAVREMKQAGYRLLKIENWKFLFSLRND